LAVPILEEANPNLPADLGDRAADVWEPLLAIADMAGDDWPGRAREAALELSGAGVRDDDSLGILLLKDIRIVFGSRKVSRLPSQVMVESLLELEESPGGDFGRNKRLDTRNLASLLRPFDIRPRQLRFDSGTTFKGYQAVDFKDGWNRYLPPERETTETGETNPAPESSSKDQNVSNVSDVSVPRGTQDSFVDGEEIVEWTR
jgi:hypothetical protein